MNKIIVLLCYVHSRLLTNDTMAQSKKEDKETMNHKEDLQDVKTGIAMTKIPLMIEIATQISIFGTINLLEEE